MSVSRAEEEKSPERQLHTWIVAPVLVVLQPFIVGVDEEADLLISFDISAPRRYRDDIRDLHPVHILLVPAIREAPPPKRLDRSRPTAVAANFAASDLAIDTRSRKPSADDGRAADAVEMVTRILRLMRPRLLSAVV